MEWEGREESSNVEDRRSLGKAGLAVGGGAGVVIIILGLIFGFDPRQLMEIVGPGEQQEQRAADPGEERMAKFTKVILHDTEVVWDDLFRKMGKTYEKPKLVLFTGQVESACGRAGASVGPFYCPGDKQVYIDLSFYRDMEKKLNAPGEFARAYVIAHEVGHHVQHLLEYPERSHRQGETQKQASVRMELQADFLAGVWAHHGQERWKFVQPGDLDSALHAAFEIGDDNLQKKSRGYVVPDSFTHGRSDQRMKWFRAGFDRGDLNEAEKLVRLPYEKL